MLGSLEPMLPNLFASACHIRS